MALLKAIGERPEVETDPKLVEKHTFIVQVNNNKQTVNLNLDKISKIPKEVRMELADGLFTEIDDQEATEIMNS